MEIPNLPKNELGFYPSWDTCYRPDTFHKNQCDKCEYRKYVYCKNSENYKNVLKEMKNT